MSSKIQAQPAKQIKPINEKQHTGHAGHSYLFQLSNIVFPNSNDDQYRVSLTRGTDGPMLWVESKKSKQQFQVTIENLSDYGPLGIPDGAVYAFLKKALELRVVTKKSNEKDTNVEADTTTTATSKDDPEVYGEVASEGFTIILTLSFCGIWKPEFIFPMLPIALDKIDIVQAQLADAHDEIVELKEEISILKKYSRDRVYLSLSSIHACPPNQYVNWNCDENSKKVVRYFKLLEANTIVVVQSGLYQINVRLTANNSQNDSGFHLLLNGETISETMNCNANGWHHTSNIQEIVELREGSKLNVRFMGNTSTIPNRPLLQKFNILRL